MLPLHPCTKVRWYLQAKSHSGTTFRAATECVPPVKWCIVWNILESTALNCIVKWIVEFLNPDYIIELKITIENNVFYLCSKNHSAVMHVHVIIWGPEEDILTKLESKVENKTNMNVHAVSHWCCCSVYSLYTYILGILMHIPLYLISYNMYLSYTCIAACFVYYPILYT